MKEKYFVNITNFGISQDPNENDGTFGIYADEDDLGRVEEVMDNMTEANRGSYLRSHVPYYPQDHSPENARYDKNLKDLYAILYDLGDEQTKAHIASMNILDSPGDNLV
jgi:hypothetical protein